MIVTRMWAEHNAKLSRRKRHARSGPVSRFRMTPPAMRWGLRRCLGMRTLFDAAPRRSLAKEKAPIRKGLRTGACAIRRESVLHGDRQLGGPI